LKAVDAKKVEHVINNMDRFSGQLTDIAKDSKEIIQKAKDAFAGIEDIGDKVRKGEGTLGKLITDDAIFQEAKKTIQTAKETMETVKSATESAKQTMETFKNVAEKVERGEGILGKLIKDESLYQETKEVIQSTKEAIQSAKDAVQTVKGIAEKVDKGEGTLGRLVNDDQLMKETEKTLKKVQKAAEGIQEQTPITVLGTIIGLFF
jgi:phospholipid/cholesterol/gamma-HCH transport system substrate-binding protein